MFLLSVELSSGSGLVESLSESELSLLSGSSGLSSVSGSVSESVSGLGRGNVFGMVPKAKQLSQLINIFRSY